MFYVVFDDEYVPVLYLRRELLNREFVLDDQSASYIPGTTLEPAWGFWHLEKGGVTAPRYYLERKQMLWA